MALRGGKGRQASPKSTAIVTVVHDFDPSQKAEWEAEIKGRFRVTGDDKTPSLDKLKLPELRELVILYAETLCTSIASCPREAQEKVFQNVLQAIELAALDAGWPTQNSEWAGDPERLKELRKLASEALEKPAGGLFSRLIGKPASASLAEELATLRDANRALETETRRAEDRASASQRRVKENQAAAGARLATTLEDARRRDEKLQADIAELQRQLRCAQSSAAAVAIGHQREREQFNLARKLEERARQEVWRLRDQAEVLEETCEAWKSNVVEVSEKNARYLEGWRRASKVAVDARQEVDRLRKEGLPEIERLQEKSRREVARANAYQKEVARLERVIADSQDAAHLRELIAERDQTKAELQTVREQLQNTEVALAASRAQGLVATQDKITFQKQVVALELLRRWRKRREASLAAQLVAEKATGEAQSKAAGELENMLRVVRGEVSEKKRVLGETEEELNIVRAEVRHLAARLAQEQETSKMLTDQLANPDGGVSTAQSTLAAQLAEARRKLVELETKQQLASTARCQKCAGAGGKKKRAKLATIAAAQGEEVRGQTTAVGSSSSGGGASGSE